MSRKTIQTVAVTVLVTIAGVLIVDVQKRFFVGILIVVLILAGMVAIGTLPPINRKLRKLVFRPHRLPADDLGIAVSRGSQDSVFPNEARFRTEGRQNYFYEIGFRPTRLVFTNLGNRVVREIDLPSEVPCRGGHLLITRFTPHGFVLSEIDTVGDPIALEIYN